MGYWDDAYEAAEESSGSGGVIAKGWVDTGAFVYATGFTGDDNEKKFFSARKLGSRKAAMAAAQKMAQDTGADRPQNVIEVCAYLDGAVKVSGDPVGWHCNQFETIPLWPATKTRIANGEVSAARTTLEILETLGIEPSKEYWFQFSWQPDPYKASLGDEGKTEHYTFQDETGNDVEGLRVPSFMYPVAIFDSKEAAIAAVGGNAEASVPEFVPEGWDATDWAECVSEIVEQKEMNAYSLAQVKKYVKDTYDVDLTMAEVVKVVK